MVRTRAPHQQRRRLRKSTNARMVGITLSEAALKNLAYVCTLLFLIILITSHRSLPSPNEAYDSTTATASSYNGNHRRLPSRLRESIHHTTTKTNKFRNFLSTGVWKSNADYAAGSGPRIAIVLPFIGKGPESIPPYLGLFCTAAGGAAGLVDFLIFHPGVMETFAERTGAHLCPTNVKFINLNSMENMARNYLLRLMDQIPEEEWELRSRDMMVRVVTHHLMSYPYALVEYKPTFGHVFADFLQDYTHWGYSDLDVVFGDLSRWITQEELTEYDIVTYGYGDQNRVYLRGQFTFHRNTHKINQLWRKCEYLSRLDQRFGKVISGEQKLKFESAEGCYSAAVLERKDIRVKYATKAFTDAQGEDPVNSHGLYIARQKLPPIRKTFLALHPRTHLEEHQRANGVKNVVVYKVKSQQDGNALLKSSPRWFELDKVYSNANQPLQWEVGRKEVIELSNPDSQANCMYWAQKKYQSKLCVSSNVTEHDTVFWVNGRLYKQRYENAKLDTEVATAPFFHFQEWKRYYRESQLASFRPDSEFTTFVLTKEGAIPVYPNMPMDGIGPPLWLSPSIKSPLGDSILHWKAGNAEIDRKLLPVRNYCLSSRPRTFPPVPPAPQCVQQVSWWDEDRVEILSMAPAWQTDLDIQSDVTLVLTLQIPIHQSSDATAMKGLLDIVIANLNRWQGQAAILLFHVAVEDESQQDDVIALMESRFKEDSGTSAKSSGLGASEGFIGEESDVKPLFGIDSCLIAAIFANLAEDEERNRNKKPVPPVTSVVSRKALLNMATDAVPTRWYVSGIELERGIVLSNDAAFFSHRAALSHQVIPGNIFFIPQWALDVDDDDYDVLTLSNMMEFHEKDGIIKEPIDFEVDQCEDDGQQRKENPEKVFDEVTSMWWELTDNILNDESSYIKNEDLTEKRARIQNDLQVGLAELLTSEKHYALFAMDESPILLTDNQGPYNGMLTHEMTREVEEFGGLRCYNALRMAQLATMGYSFNVLPGAFAASTRTSRSAAYWNGLPEGDRGEEDDIIGASRCDGCFMFDEDHEVVLENISRDERKRPAKAAVLWEEPDHTPRANV